MFKRIIKYSNKHFGLFKKLASITDKRIKPRIATIKIVTVVICMQFSNLGSLNSLTQTLASGKYPSVSTIARVTDCIDLDEIRNVGKAIYLRARKSKMLNPYYGRWIGIVDGHEVTVSDFCKCSHCRKRKLRDKNGNIKYQYYHSFTAFILAGPDFSFTLDIEPILAGEGEITSAQRLLERVCRNYPKAFEVVIGDGLYLKGNIFKLLEAHHKKAIAVLKEERRQLFEEANKLSLMVEPKTYKQGKTIYRVWDHEIEGCWDGYGKKVRVIVSEETATKRSHACDGAGWQEKTETTNWMWVTNLFEDFCGDLKNTVKVCHARWQIENKCFNETVNTWNADHIYRHSENAIIAFLLLLFICVNIFNIFYARNIKDRTIKSMVFLINKINAEFLAIKRPLPLIPVPL
ncbi:MAG: transposase [Candidatus Humimicrobiaceae bacterium]